MKNVLTSYLLTFVFWDSGTGCSISAGTIISGSFEVTVKKLKNLFDWQKLEKTD